MNSHLLTQDTAKDYLAGMSRVTDLVARHLAADAPSTGATVADLTPAVAAVDLDRPAASLDAALSEVTDLYLRDAIWFHHPSYVAHLNCPVVLPAVLAEGIIAAVNTSVDTWDQSAGGTLIEQRLVRWTADRIGFDDAADGVFTSGGTQSNLQGLLLARGEAMRDAGPHAQAQLRILATEHSHFSVVKAARIMGLHPSAVIAVPTDESGGLSVAALATALDGVRERGEIAMAVVATAGTTDLGVIDPVDEIADLARAHGAWLHVDAAYGGGLLVSRRRRHLLAGIERADSVTVDFHKTYFQPVSSSALLVREPADLAAVAHHADYLNPAAEAASAEAEPNQVDKSLQTTRRFDALKLWITLRAVGPEELGGMVDRVCDLATQVRGLLEDDPDLHVLGTTDLSTVVFRFHPAGLEDSRADELQPLIRRILFQSGRAMVARTTIEGTAHLKLTLLNPEATLADIAAVLDLVRATGRGLLAGTRLAAAGEGR